LLSLTVPCGPRPDIAYEAGERQFPAIPKDHEVFAVGIFAGKRAGEQQLLWVMVTNALATRWLVPRLPD